MSKKLIAHRGNIIGKQPSRENNPDYVVEAIMEGYDCEIDLWYDHGRLLLGHDDPKYNINQRFLEVYRDFLWIHCKNKDAFTYMHCLHHDMNYFYHESDAYTMTSKGYIWCYIGNNTHHEHKYYGLDVACNSILLPEGDGSYYPEDKEYAGICSDNISNYKHLNTKAV